MGACDLLAPLTQPPASHPDGSVSAAPPQDQHICVLVTVPLERIDILLDRLDLGSPEQSHQVMVLGIVGDVSGPIGLLQATDSVLETGGPRYRPGAGQGDLVPAGG